MDVDTRLGCRVRHIEERLEAVKDAAESMQLATLLEVRLHLIEKIS